LINAYVDDALSPGQRLEVEEFLSVHPEVARRVADYRNQNRGLHELYDRYLSEPLPEAVQLLEQRIVARFSRRRTFNALARASAAAAVAILAVAGGWWGSRSYLAATEGQPEPREVARAPARGTVALASSLPLAGTQAAKVAAPTLDGAGAINTGGFPAPDLRQHGFLLTSSRDIGRPDGTNAARLVYESKEGLQVTLYIAAIADTGTRKVSLSRRGPIWFLLWNHRGRSYSMIGEVERDTMLALGATINARWATPRAGGKEPEAGAPRPLPEGQTPASPGASDKAPELREKTLIRPAASEEKALPEPEAR
jgi:anti-sigma factor RsiW